ncbi:MAG: hypothetical protein K6B70_07480 [Clostridia bacterium]|nr:hypothetical protein [Clostridia bacterium]
MNYIVVLILLVLSACALFLALKYKVCSRAENSLSAYIKFFKKYERILISDCTDISIRVFEIFPNNLYEKNYIAKSSADLRKFFIIVGYRIDRYSALLNEISYIDSNLYEDFVNYFRNLKMISFNNGEPFREADLES